MFDPTGPSSRYHVQFAVEPFRALGAPMTELTVTQLKEGVDLEQFNGMAQTPQDALAERLGGDVSAGACDVSFEYPRSSWLALAGQAWRCVLPGTP